ncbi:glycosyltransferase family 4 protein [Sulfoacidibacillus thermotolerans]|uniref:Glycosyltransferase subfamily 4-like N-terminal domain-containing protein n=1 Tax=Sulfoacidibacillus thermotolerans TaxID=1765684 RepID=A0A2U3D645_SULT2|nr:glycosyltransferase family 4 protein [Sulfoacidibacillus thermotolerans]PWI56755.1 hypothetical protein BM613_12065 [Sulfoacidibacillus thermotolerans]
MNATYNKALTKKHPLVLHVVAAGEFGGAEAQILALIKGLQKKERVQVAVATYYEGRFTQAVREVGIATHVLQSRQPLSDVRALRELAQTLRPDLIHTHGVRASLAGRLTGSALRIPVVTTVHSDLFYDYAPPKRALMMQLEARTRHLSRRVIAVSDALKAVLVRRGYKSGQLIVVRNALEIEEAHKKLEEANLHPLDLRKHLHISEKTPLLLCVARLHPVKRHDFLLRAFAKAVFDLHVDAHLVIAGDGPERANLEALAQELGLLCQETDTKQALSRVHFLGVRQDIYALLREVDAVALTSQMEGLPIAPLEAMFAGRPVIATRVGGLSEIIEEGDAATGLLIPFGHVDLLAQAIARLLRDRALCARLGENGKRRVLTHFTASQMVDRVQNVYLELVKS